MSLCLCEMFTRPGCLNRRTTEITASLACWQEQREIGLIWKREDSAWMLEKLRSWWGGREPNSGECVIEGFEGKAGQQLWGVLHQSRDVPSALFWSFCLWFYGLHCTNKWCFILKSTERFFPPWLNISEKKKTQQNLPKPKPVQGKNSTDFDE